MKGRGPERILFVRTDRLGDLLMNVPAISRLRQNFPKSRIALLASRAWSPVLKHLPDLDEVIDFEPGSAASMEGKFAMYRRLTAQNFDAIVVSNPSKFLHTLAFALSAPLRAGINRKWGFLMNHRTVPRRPGDPMHEIDRNLELLNGFCPKPWNGEIDLGFGKHPLYARVLQKLGIPAGRRAIAFHVSTSDPLKRWPAPRFAAVIREFLDKTDHPVVLIGHEVEPLDGLGPNAVPGRLIDLRGRTSLEELGIVLREVRCLVSLDSGPYHVAWMQKTPVVGLFIKEARGSDPRRWGVYDSYTEYRQIHKSSADITEREVIDAAYSLLEIPRVV